MKTLRQSFFSACQGAYNSAYRHGWQGRRSSPRRRGSPMSAATWHNRLRCTVPPSETGMGIRFLVLALVAGWTGDGLVAQQNEKADAKEAPTVAYRFDVPLPISGKSVARRVEQALRKLS